MLEHPKETSPTRLQKSNTFSLSTPVQYIKGVGPKKSALLQKLGIFTWNDALYYFPFRYEDRRKIFFPREIQSNMEGSLVCVRARVDSVREVGAYHKKRLEVSARGQDGGWVHATWFHAYPGMKERLENMQETVFTGTLKFFRNQPQIVHPDFASMEEHAVSIHWGRIVPIYSTVEGLSQKSLRELLYKILQTSDSLLHDVLPDSIREKLQLPNLRDCLWEMHFPKNEVPNPQERLNSAQYRVVWEEFFHYQLLQRIRIQNEKQNRGIPIIIRNRLAQKFRAQLGFELTQGQEQALAEILTDLHSAEPMHRILQGDVGSGKTAVAFLAMTEILENSFQGAILVPTETLAEQHYRNALKLFPEEIRSSIVLLKGSLKKSEKKNILTKIKEGDARLVIGTHALLQDSVEWKNLALVIVDEQHRFGVRQRSFLRNLLKNSETKIPHLLTMSATPIPRSLAMTIFGELKMSTIRERPANRLPIATKVLAGKDRQKVYNLFHREVRNGRQAYLIYPLVDDSEKETMAMVRSVVAEAERLRSGPLQGLRLGVVHGKMPTEERIQVMQAFAKGELDILVSTTVVEVGIDVPNATVIAIENAERFGLAQLHQLRGRVGRGEHQSYCVLVTDTAETSVHSKANLQLYSDEAEEEDNSWFRLRVLERSNDGFVISEEDLKLRGAGDFIGTKQSGIPNFRFANLERDYEVFISAKKELEILLQEDPSLSLPKYLELQQFAKESSAKLADILQTG